MLLHLDFLQMCRDVHIDRFFLGHVVNRDNNGVFGSTYNLNFTNIVTSLVLA